MPQKSNCQFGPQARATCELVYAGQQARAAITRCVAARGQSPKGLAKYLRTLAQRHGVRIDQLLAQALKR